MSDRSQLKSPCRFCRVVLTHLVACPKGNATAEQIWHSGYTAAVNRKPNGYADDHTFTLGYVSGEIFLKEEDKRMHASEPPMRASIPGDAELALALHERRHVAPSIRPTPPGQIFTDEVMANAERALF